MSHLNRRKFLAGTATAAGSLALASTLGGNAFAQDRRIRHFWWGNPERDKRTFAVIDIFNGKNPGIVVEGETLGFNDYFTKLTTQIAGGNMPDVFQNGYGNMVEYISKGTTKSLDEAVAAGKLDISKIDAAGITAGTFDGKLYGLTIGANSMATLINARLWEEAGIDTDPITWTYDDLKAAAVKISELGGAKGTDDMTADWGAFNVYLGQRGFANPYTADGQFAFGADLVVDYWKLWGDIRDAGGTPSAEDSVAVAGIADLDKQGVVTGKSAISYAWSNQLVGTQALMQDKLAAGMRPHLAGGVSGQSIQPSQFICLSRDVTDEDAAIAYMSAFVNDPDMTAVLGLERGIPQQSDVRAALASKLTEAEAVTVAYFDAIQPHVAPLAPAGPAGVRELEEAFETRAAVSVLLGQASIEDAAAQYMDEAADILRRAQG
jgi:multiple sugar transport system substrate-binding protein